jgi:hypothetical protein
MIIKAMLKAGIMDEMKENPLGTSQGGVISPLLANAYLDTLDQWVTREWENKKTRTKYSQHGHMLERLRNRSNLKPAYLVRYADDWTLTTSSRSNAVKWKRKIAKYLDVKLKLTLSEEKTIITDIRKKPIHFLGFTFKVLKGKSRTGYITKTSPDPQRLKAKVAEILRNTKGLKRIRPGIKGDGKERLIAGINLVNSQIRGVIQYYQAATRASPVLSKYSYVLRYAAHKALRRYGGKWVAACEVNNLTSVHSKYKTKLPAVTLRGYTTGITSLAFCEWTKTQLKNQSETPYTEAGRDRYQKRTSRSRLQARADELLLPQPSEISSRDLKLYNFEFYLNRAYAFNRDSGKCRVCDNFIADDVHIHHIRPNLSLNLVNRVSNLASVHNECHAMVHNGNDYSSLPKNIWLKILRYREKLNTLS